MGKDRIYRKLRMNCAWLMLMLAVIVLLPGCGKKGEESQTAGSEQDRHAAVLQEIRSVNKLVLSSMTVNKTVRTDRDAWYKIGKRIGVYSFNGYLRGYVDLSLVDPSDLSLDEVTHTAVLTLPPVQTEVVGSDVAFNKLYENVGALRSDISPRERAQLREEATADFNREVVENPEFSARLRETAMRKARQYFQALLSSEGYQAVVKFRDTPKAPDHVTVPAPNPAYTPPFKKKD